MNISLRISQDEASLKPTSLREHPSFTASDIPETRSLEETRSSTSSNPPGFTHGCARHWGSAVVVKQHSRLTQSLSSPATGNNRGSPAPNPVFLPVRIQPGITRVLNLWLQSFPYATVAKIALKLFMGLSAGPRVKPNRR
ncbi:hypothetical protein C8J56DRAFT_1059651 [Mycena floridula]|nr:hypothetical protein C8J56DRAFT_1059651 [Mycena floridula]